MIRDVSQWPQLALRPLVGIGLMYHGGPALLTSTGYANFAHMLREVGLPWPELLAGFVAGLELIGGIAILAGALTMLFSLLLAVELAVRIGVIFLLGNGFPKPLEGQPSLPGYETNLLYIGFLTALAFSGAGLNSVDRWRQQPVVHEQRHYGRRPRGTKRITSWT
jgi:putative oxidoreductase